MSNKQHSKIYVNGKPLGIATNVNFSVEDPIADYKPGPFHNTASFEIKNAEMGPALKKIFDVNKKAMDVREKLNELMQEVGKIVPTMVFIGTTSEKYGACLITSPEESNEKKMLDLCASVAQNMKMNHHVRELLFSAVSWFMQEHTDYREAMKEAIGKMEVLDEHQRAD